MTNEALLREEIKGKGLKMGFIAEALGISYQCFLNKIGGKSEFNAKEISKLTNLLNLEVEKRDAIFFG